MKYLTLGRSGLKISQLCLGTATFGAGKVGTDEIKSRDIFKRYLELGGNSFDTSDNYSNGASEKLLGKLLKEYGNRDELIIGTKYSFNYSKHNPCSSGNGRKNIYIAIENSLRNLQVDYLDMYWMYLWDTLTPCEEVVATFNDLIREGKVRYYGLSNVPAWYATRAYSSAELSRSIGPIALQLEYSLLERSIEREHIPAAQALNMGISCWSPLAGGFLSGKYQQLNGEKLSGEGRLAEFQKSNSFAVPHFSEREWNIVNYLLTVAKEIDKTPAQIALNWLLAQACVTCVNIGATDLAHLNESVASLNFDLPDEIKNKLTQVSNIPACYPYKLFGKQYQQMLNNGFLVKKSLPVHHTGILEEV